MGKVTYTPRQEQVIHTRKADILVAAAAGSGKTAVLTERILSLISDPQHPVDIDHLLIVTFTKAAAAEMRERIGKKIEEWLYEHPEDANMQRQQTLLYNAQITTIDSFCLFVIKNNFADIELDPGFRIMDDGEGRLMKQDTLDEILEEHYCRISEGGDPDFAHLVDCYCDQGKEEDLKKMILSVFELAESNPFPEDWLEECAKDYEIESLKQLYETDWWKEGIRLSEFLMENAARQARKGIDLCNQPEGPGPYLETMQAAEKYCKDLLETTSYASRCRILHKMELPAFKRVRAKSELEEEYKAQVADCRENIKKIFQELKERYYIFYPNQLLSSHRYIGKAAREFARLTMEFAERFTERKRERNLIDFSDMEHLALKILIRKQEDGTIEPTETAREYQAYFAHVLVDEYQDSNFVQEYILSSISNGKNYFMVGDVKQSIYRFRLARPEIFLNKYECFQKSGEQVAIDLNQNFRSRSEVLESVNDIFEQLMIPEVAGMSYDEKAKLYLGASYPEDGNGAYRTEVLLLDENAEPGAGIAPAADIDEDEKSVSGRETGEAVLIASRIREMLESRLEVKDKKSEKMRPLQLRDIVILVRSAGKLAEEIRKTLEANGLPAYLSAKSGYFSAMEIRTILNYLSVIDNPRQDIPLYGALTSYFGNLTEEEMAQLRSGHQRESLWDTVMEFLSDGQEAGTKDASGQGTKPRDDGLRESQGGENSRQQPEEHDIPLPERTGRQLLVTKLHHFVSEVSRYRKMASYTTIRNLLRALLDETGYLNYMAAFPGGERRQANLYMLLEKAAAFEQTSFHGLYHFIRYIGQLKEQEVDYGEAGTLDENADVIRIMTIHKSKGLEFPVCFVAGLGKRLNKKDASKSVLADVSMGIGLDYINPGKRRQMSGAKKRMMAELILREGLAEELRVLYVAMTRAKEKLILTGTCKNAENVLSQTPDEIIPGKLLRANTYLDVILPGYGAAGKLSDFVKVISQAELQNQEAEKEVKEFLYESLLEKQLPENAKLLQRLTEQMHLSYAYPQLKGLYTKTSVSEIKKAAYEDEEAAQMFREEEKTVYIPLFARETEERASGARRGTAYHRFMELLPFEQIEENRSDLKGFLQRTLEEKVSAGYIQEEDAALIRLDRCEAFLNTQLAGRMCRAAGKGLLCREKPFFLGIPACELKEGFPEDEFILVQGVIDAYLEEEDGILIMDYKTDQVQRPEQLTGRYRKQLELYARAVSQITGKKVKGAVIYSFALGQEIALQ